MVKLYLESYLCPHCKTKCSFYGTAIGNSVALYCNSCRKGVYFRFRDSISFKDNLEVEHISSDYVADSYPKPVVIADAAIPADIADDFIEANRCISVEAKKATVTMCRRVLQTACISKGVNPNLDLVKQIDELESKRVINPSMKDVAQTIRKIGNWGAHPQGDPLKDVTIDDALEILKFTSEFLDEVFVRPARLTALKQKKKMK